MFSSPVVSICYVGLGAACTFDVLLTGYNATVLGRDLAPVGVGMIRSRGLCDQDGPYIVVCYEAMIDVSKDIFGCSLDVVETIFGYSLACAHAYLILDCSCEVITPFYITVVTANTTLWTVSQTKYNGRGD